jgi:hypothetical protein
MTPAVSSGTMTVIEIAVDGASHRRGVPKPKGRQTRDLSSDASETVRIFAYGFPCRNQDAFEQAATFVRDAHCRSVGHWS